MIDVTTNGALLTPEMVSRLAELKPVYVNLSLISADEADPPTADGRPAGGVGDRGHRAAARTARSPSWARSCPGPSRVSTTSTKTIEYLDAHDARLIRVGDAGADAPPSEVRAGRDRGVAAQGRGACLGAAQAPATPVIISPFAYVSTSIDAVVEGVIRSSPAAAAGIRLGDRLTAVDGKRGGVAGARRQPAQTGRERGVVDIEILRDGTTIKAQAAGARASRSTPIPTSRAATRPLDFPGMSFGLCLPGAFHLQYLKQIHAAIHARQARRTLVVVSPFYRELVGELAGRSSAAGRSTTRARGAQERVLRWQRQRRRPVGPGGHRARRGTPPASRADRPDLLVLPSSFLSRWGRDLRGVPYTELEATLGIDIALVKCERIVL